METISKKDVLNSLMKIIDPESKKDLISLGCIKNVSVDENNITVDIEFPSDNEAIAEKMIDECYSLISKDIPEAKNIIIRSEKDGGQVKRDSALPGVKHTIAVASGKGGVGKSTVAVNLAIALAKNGAKVGLVDADIYGPSIPLMLGIEGKPKIYQNANTKKMIPLENYGIKLMSIGFLIDEDNPVIWRGPMASGAIKQFMLDVDWDILDYLIFDLPPGTGDIQLTLVQTIPLTGAVIVTTPQDVALVDARKGLKMFERVNVPVLGIIENMSYFVAPDTGNRYNIFGTGGGENLANKYNTKFLGNLPLDPRICEGSDNGKPIVAELAESENAKKFSLIAKQLSEEVKKINSQSNSSNVEIVI